MPNKNGFTLLEMLFVLGIVSIIILISVPIQITSLEKQQEKQFLETFEFDILYIQALAATSATDIVKIVFRENHYVIHKGSVEGTIATRSFPSDWKIDERLIKKGISFYNTGIVRESGIMTIETKHAKYNVVFPLGKGRCYIEKQ